MNEMWEGELDDLLAAEAGLTAWELDFVEAMEALRDNERSLTEKQIEKIHEVWDRRCR